MTDMAEGGCEKCKHWRREQRPKSQQQLGEHQGVCTRITDATEDLTGWAWIDNETPAGVLLITARSFTCPLWSPVGS